ncbi:putative LRR containing protein [Trachipleistophora hominis]|uniref:Putative LRR containing protein n=1 Tax=Trachipleistophora hominis TaxID=72359 RepID=L7JTX5_TRAHO|nr:putative LRR containing protein [Trachipleistophora hominis]
MLLNLSKYVDATFKFILIVKQGAENAHEEHIIFDNLEDTGLESYLNACYEEQALHSLVHDMKNLKSEHCCFGTNNDLNISSDCSSFYFNSFCGFEKIHYENYRDWLRNENTQYKVIRVPFTKLFLEKIIKLSEFHIPNFTSEEKNTIKEVLNYDNQKNKLLELIMQSIS